MKLVVRIGLLLVIVASVGCLVLPSKAQVRYRRGTPTPGFPRSQFYVVDSDDESPYKPTFKFIDTTFVTWIRVTGFPASDTSSSRIGATVDTVLMPYYLSSIWLLQPPFADPMGHMTPGSSISTSGTICFSGIDSSSNNQPMPVASALMDLVAPLWGDFELIQSGSNRTNIYVRPVSPDSFYVSFYNLGLKGTNGQIRATFQVVFRAVDSSITFEYKSFDGTLNGVPAAQILQQSVTIGVMGRFLNMGTMYLHKGYYYATSSTGHAQSLHNGLAVKFFRMDKDAFQITGISFPPYDRYELTSSTMAPSCDINNSSDSAIRVFVTTTMTNLSTGVVFYSKHDSIDVALQNTATFTGASYQGLPTGAYKVTFVLSYRNNISDQWAENNTATRYFVYLGNPTVPFREEFNSGLSPSLWSNNGADVRDASTIMYTPIAPVAKGVKAVVLNRLDPSGQSYPTDAGGDTLTSAPMDLTGQPGPVYLYFHYQRGLSSDSSQAGIYSRFHSGPELPIPYAQGGMAQFGDTLLVEGLVSSGNRWNPDESSWSKIGVITGGFDVKTQTFRALLGNQFLHDHFRMRLRIQARNSIADKSPMTAQYFLEDADNFVVDAIHVEPIPSHKTELEPLDVDLGNGVFNHIPRDLSGGLTPKVRVMNNGDDVALGLFIAHLRIWDGIGRIVYDRISHCDIPSPQTDQWYTLPAWDIHGSQGGVFTALVTLEATDYDLYKANDTNLFYKPLVIDDQYSMDDGQPDAVGTSSTAPTNFYYTFTPLGNDTLRGCRFYYTGSSSAASWSVDIFANGTTVNRSFSVTPSGAGWYQANFAPVALKDTTVYRLHFTMSSGTNFGGDNSNGLVYYTLLDSVTSANNRYGTLHPDVLSHFFYSPTVSYTSPTATDAANGGFLVPMFRLVFSGATNYLPVELASISAQRNSGGAVVLSWKTAVEENVALYEIERVSTHELIAQLPARNISTGAEYAAMDRTAPADNVLYEIFARDKDGSRSSLGRVLAAPFGNNAGLTIAAYPNPARGTLSITSNQQLDGVLLIDPLGRVVRRFGAVSGTESFDVTNVPNGSYFLCASTDAKSVRTRITILH